MARTPDRTHRRASTLALSAWLGLAGCVTRLALGGDDAGPAPDAGLEDAAPADAPVPDDASATDASDGSLRPRLPPPESCAPPTTYLISRTRDQGREAMDSRVLDVDLDGANDALWVNQLDQTVTIWFGDGAGGFTDRVSVTVGRANFFEAGDIDGDGLVDLVATNQDLNRIVIAAGLGGRAFGAPRAIRQTSFPAQILLADVDDDRDLDMLLNLRVEDCFAVRLNDGEGAFVAHRCLYPAAGSLSWVQADLDGDGRDEIVVTRETERRVEVLRVNAERMELAHALDVGATMIPDRPSAYDLDGDGDEEVLLTGTEADRSAQSIRSLTWDEATGAFEACPAPITTLTSAIGPARLGDLDGDAIPDVVTSTTCSFCTSTYIVMTTR